MYVVTDAFDELLTLEDGNIGCDKKNLAFTGFIQCVKIQ